MNKDTIAGKTKEIGGKVRATIGRATGDKEAEIQGKIDEATGNAQKNYGKMKEKIKETLGV